MIIRKIRHLLAVAIVLVLYPTDKRLGILSALATAALIYIIPSDNVAVSVTMTIYGSIMGFIIGHLISADLELRHKRRVK